MSTDNFEKSSFVLTPSWAASMAMHRSISDGCFGVAPLALQPIIS